MQQSIISEFRYHLLYGISSPSGILLNRKIKLHTNDLNWAREEMKPAARKFKNGMAVIYDSFEDKVVDRYIHLDS